MYKTGHYGAALLLYAPVGGYLLRSDPVVAVVVGAGAVWLARLPDIDLRLPFISHRGPTHTLLFLALVAGALGGVGWLAGVRGGLGNETLYATLGVAIALFGVGSHLVADMLTPAGVPLFWPLSSRTYSWRVARASNRIANWGLLALGVFATIAAGIVALRV
ncbi:metal-dependent hydrolase [Natronomonas sp. EA1]|uniref:metal-dependent hydrolase n=1 Tax=Natronomonas sp. EA1 TaxID=3421655 RepID=UPI003EBC7264